MFPKDRALTKCSIATNHVDS